MWIRYIHIYYIYTHYIYHAYQPVGWYSLLCMRLQYNFIAFNMPVSYQSITYEWYAPGLYCIVFSVSRAKWSETRPHDDVIKWKHFPRYWPFVREIHRSPVNSPHKGQWRGALMFSLICVWINGRVNNREAGDLRRDRAHYDVTVMMTQFYGIPHGLFYRLWSTSCAVREILCSGFYIDFSSLPLPSFLLRDRARRRSWNLYHWARNTKTVLTKCWLPICSSTY